MFMTGGLQGPPVLSCKTDAIRCLPKPILPGMGGPPCERPPPERDARVWARLVRVMFYTPGFLALLLIKTGEGFEVAT